MGTGKDFMKDYPPTVVPDTRQFDEMGNVITGGYGYTIRPEPAGGGRGHVNPPAAIPPAGYRPDSLRGQNEYGNSYVHNTDNNTVPSGPTGTYSLEFTPNILDYFDSYTYHFKLFITPIAAAYEGNVLSRDAQTILVESGVSDLTIDKVEFQGITTPSVEAGTGTQTNIKFEIVEPSGAGFLDKMFYESVGLGVGNWLVMPVFLQLEFKGRSPEDSQSSINGAPSGLSGLKWVWPIKITNMKANVTNVGTRYDVEAIVYDEFAQSNSYFCIQHNAVLDNISNFGKAMTDLENKLNADQFEKLIDNYSIPDTYRIVVDPELAKLELVPPNYNKDTSRAGDYVDLSKKSASFNSGTSIDKIVDALLGNTKEMQKIMQSAPTSTSTPDAANKASPMRKLWRVITETRPVAYDALRQDNAVEITIYIVQYNLGLIETDASQTGQTPETKKAAEDRLSSYAEHKILNKKYNYIFTGLNDQILTFDLNMNFSYAASLSRFGGIYIDSAASDRGISQQENARQERDAAERLRKALQFINDPKNAENIDAEINAAKESINNTNIDDNLKKKYAKILAYAKPSDRKAFTSQLQAAGGLDVAGDLNTAVLNAKSLATPIGDNLKFVSDIDIYNTDAQEAKENAASLRRGKLRPVPYRESTQEINLAMAMDPSSDSGRARTASVFSTALYSTLDASLQQVTLTIKGDPYWLYPNPLGDGEESLPFRAKMSDLDAINSIKNKRSPNSVNVFSSDNFIIIRFRTPRIYNETTGSIDPFTEVETFSGVYKVVRITSKFEMGKFSQELTCLLDPVINLADFPQFLRDIEESVKIPDPVLESVLKSSIPDTATKQDRLGAGAGRGFVNPPLAIPSSDFAGAGRGFVNPPLARP